MQNRSYFYLVVFYITGILLFPGYSFSQTAANNILWQHKFDEQKVFIQNKGQYDGKDLQNKSAVLFGVKNEGAELYFRPNGLTYRFDVFPFYKHKEKERIKGNIKPKTHLLNMEWVNCSKNPHIVSADPVSDYYCFGADNKTSINFVKAYKKIIYKDIYPGIDVEYTFHEQNGIKYIVVIHPGADISAIRMKYSGFKKMTADAQGNLHFSLPVGDIIDHAPVTFYETNKQAVSSKFIVNGSEVGFSIDPSYDRTKTLIVDPWTTNPSFPNESKAYDVERDAAGNLYVYGGKNPYQLKKYTSGGTLLWTYVSTFTGWYGDLAVNNLGVAWISEGFNAANSFSNISKVNTNGTLAFTTAGPTSPTPLEYWCLSFNCDYSVLTVAGGVWQLRISEIDQTNGTISGTTTSYPGNSEARSMTMGPSGNFYCVTSSQNELIALTPAYAQLYVIPNGYGLVYSSTLYNTGYTSGDAGMNTVATDANFVYTCTGAVLKKWDVTTGAFISSAAVPGGTEAYNGGILVDSCGSVYVGTLSQVHKFDNSLNLVSSAAVSGAVYGMCFGASNEVVACGNGFVTALNLTACQPVFVIPSAKGDTTMCAGGTAQLNAYGATSYLWTPSAGLSNPNIANPTANPSSTTQYVVDLNYPCGTIKDTVTVTINSCGYTALGSGASVCPGSCGDVSVSAVGGTGPYVYLWSSGQTGTGPYNVCPVSTTTYTITVTDANSISTTTTATLTVRTAPTVPLSTTDASCGLNNGIVSASPTGGSTPYTYLWSNGATSSAAGNLSANSYTVTVTDGAGCSTTSSATVTAAGTATVTVSSITATCSQSNGSANANPTGGTSPYSYLWSNGATTATVNNLAGGTYTITVTDGSGCTSITTASVSTTTSPTVTTSSTASACTVNNGSASVSPSGGTGAYTYLWSNGDNSATTNNVGAATYTITVTDNAGCTVTSTVVVSNVNGPTTTISSTLSGCLVNNGSASANPSGGTSPYTYVWSNGTTSATANNVGIGIYTVTVTDNSGCTITSTVAVGPKPNPTITTSTTPATCSASDGSATANPAGGTSPYFYSWSNGASSATTLNITVGTYTVTVADSEGCTNTTTAVVANNSTLSATVSAIPECPETGGDVIVRASGGTGPYNYLWSPGSSVNDTVTGLTSSIYTVTVTDVNLCVVVQTVTLANFSSPVTSAGADVTITAGNSTTLNGSGGINYLWTPATDLSCDTCASTVSTPATTTTYTLLVQDANGCLGYDEVTVFIEIICDGKNSVLIPTAFSPNGDGLNDFIRVRVANCIKEFEFIVYNRWGEHVFETSDTNNVWSGSFRGQSLDTGTYAYVIRAKTVDGELIKKEGNITLVK